MKKIAMLALVAILALLALASCKKEPDESSKKPDESSSTEVKTYTVTFQYGVDVWGENKDKEDIPDKLKFEVSVQVEEGDDAEYPSIPEINNEVGYKFAGWDTPAAFLKDVEEDIVVKAVYEKLEMFTYTFKNADGTVIFTGEAWEGSSLADEAPKAADAVYYFPEDKKGSLKTPVEHRVGDVTYWIEDADKSKLTTSLVMPIGSIFVDWKSSEAGSTVNNLRKNNVVFTASLSAADEIIGRVEAGTITKENLLDTSNYTKLDAKLYKYIISNTVNSTDQGADGGNCSIIDQYDSREAAAADGKGNEYDAALAKWDKYTKGIDADFYMAWDGEFIYFLAEVKDPTVVTQGAQYCTVKNPFENDGVELWYLINGKYAKMTIDACGYRLASGENPSAYLDYLAQQGYVKSKVTDASGNAIDVATNKEPRVIAGATGYTVAFAIPAYAEPADKEADLNNKQNWGTKLSRGDTFYVSLQLNNISAPATEKALAYALKNKDDQNPLLSAYNNSTTGKANGGEENNAAMARVHLGWQTNYNTGTDGTLRFALG